MRSACPEKYLLKPGSWWKDSAPAMEPQPWSVATSLVVWEAEGICSSVLSPQDLVSTN
jgi:hypothetical protein